MALYIGVTPLIEIGQKINLQFVVKVMVIGSSEAKRDEDFTYCKEG